MRITFVPLVLGLAASAAVVDRVAVVVGETVITQSEVLDELRLTEFQNGQPLDLGPQQRRAAAERLVDQQLIRKEMEVARYPEPAAGEADTMLRNLQQRFAAATEFRAALEKYGITEDQLKRHLLWQLTAMRFTEVRFRNAIPEAEQSANRTDGSEQAPAAASGVDDQMNAWLKETRAATKIKFKNEAFQ